MCCFGPLLMRVYVYLMKNGLEKVDFRSTAVDGLVKVVYVLIAVAGLEMLIIGCVALMVL